MERIKLTTVFAAVTMLSIAGQAEAGSQRHRMAAPAKARLQSHDGRYYVDFLARQAGIVGHSFIQVGRLDARGGRHPAITAGLYPADPNRVFDAPGKVTALPADLKADPRVRYRVLVSERTYRKTPALMNSLPGNWKRYDLVQHNCNSMVASVARHLGLAAPGDTADIPVNYVRALAALNGGRERASWR